MKICTNLPALYDAIAGISDLYLPVKKGGVTDFASYTEGAEVNLRAKTARSVKDFFFTQTETLMGFKVEGKSITVEDLRPEIAPFVVLGVRGCDAASFAILDSVFLAEPVDTVYAARREAATVVTLACGRPAESCFCNKFGIDAAAPGGDVTTWLVGDTLYWQANTVKGEALTEKLGDTLAESDDAAVKEQQENTRKVFVNHPLQDLSLDHLVGAKEETFWNHPVWGEMSSACLACGTCTYSCPTCQCYDVRDFDCGDSIERFRCWDSCMYSDFTKMAHGNIRNTQAQRFRQRFLHKLVYFAQRNEGKYGCVGCGRCVEKCPSKLGIVKVIKALGGK